MATDESSFKSEWRNDVKEFFGDKVKHWPASDKFTYGISDDLYHYEGILFPVEAKWAKIPKRESSKCLSHEVSQSQINFINDIRRTGGRGMGCILVGMKDVAVLMKELKTNYTLKELKDAPRIMRISGKWEVEKFFEIMKGFYEPSGR